MRRRVLFVIGQLGFGGSEKQFTLLVEGLSSSREVQVVCTSDSLEPWGPVIEKAGVPLHHPGGNGRFHRFSWLARTIRRTPFDVMVIYSVRNSVGLLASLLTARKVVYTERSLGTWKGRAYRAVDALVYRRASLLVANSEATAGWVRGHFPGVAGKIRVVRNGIPAAPEDCTALPRDGKVVFCLVAGFRPWKGHQFLLEAVAEVAGDTDQLRVDLVGDGPGRAEIETWVREKHLEGIVRFCGWQHDPSPFIKNAHVNLNVSRHESMSNAVMEGMLHGRASIVTRVGGNTELVEDGVHGLVVEYGDAHALAQAMRRCIANRPELEGFGARAHAKILRDFSVASMVTAMEELIDAV